MAKRTVQWTKQRFQLAKRRFQLAKRRSASAKRLRATNVHGFAWSERLSSKAKRVCARAAPLRLETETSPVEEERHVLRSEAPCGDVRPSHPLISIEVRFSLTGDVDW